MLCAPCRRVLISRLRGPRPGNTSSASRLVSTAPATSSAAPANPSSAPSQPSRPTPPSLATSSVTTGHSQSLSTSALPSTSAAHMSDPRPHPPIPRPLTGSIPGGAPLHGLAYLKSAPTVHAREDSAYPPWLWTLLEHSKTKVGQDPKPENAVDVKTLTRKQREKYLRKQAKLAQHTPPKVPLHEQSADLTAVGEGAGVSLQRREEVTRSMRVARRKEIREGNFLRSL